MRLRILGTILILLLIILFIELIHFEKILGSPITVFKEGVNIGNVNLSKKTWDEGILTLNKIFTKPIYLNTEASSRAVTLPEIGISLNRDKLGRYTKVCRYSSPRLFCKNTSNEPVNSEELITIDREKLEGYLKALETDFQFIAKNTVVSFEDYTFRTPSPKARVVLDKSAFETKKSIAKLISHETIKLKINVTASDDLNQQHEETLNLVEKITNPLLIKYGRNPIYIQKDTLKSFITTKEKDGYLYGEISHKEVSDYLDSLKEQYETEDLKIIHEDSVEAIRKALLFRASEYQVNTAVILPIEGNPKTDGSLHDVYLEVIKSQQRLYRFEKGKLTKTYIISTGLTWETPPGEYSILGKQKMTISYFGSWYMPDYLPIGTINGYKFGFHAIPYHMDTAGNIYSRDPNTMGSPATGGCIQLKPKDALELFNWAWIGIPVYIYE